MWRQQVLEWQEVEEEGVEVGERWWRQRSQNAVDPFFRRLVCAFYFRLRNFGFALHPLHKGGVGWKSF